ncbi:MAG TPA: transglutaminase family protein [Niabella sp.]|nr:transglutaminase family protein [Niabella sp.]HOZ97339.1 transglutaminase family protein [Niabella sp.]HQW15390.1 transglutaminase family protein [Niabella sp.]HQX20564.1 transglutaminase family protein [Niabella sp.]HQX40949.1 transglutaminase family protein [Niabella sp.]
MQNDKEIKALLSLLEDPDKEVFEAISSRIVAYGNPIIDNLEELWEHTFDEEIQERIEMIIHRIHFSNLKNDFKEWAVAPHSDLLPGALLVSKLLYPDLQTAKVIQDIERLRRNIWLELNNYLTPLEQINVIQSILYNYFGLKNSSTKDLQPQDYLLSHIIESKKGNQTGNGVLYLLLTELLDIPVKLILIPQQFVLAYLKSGNNKDQENLHLNIEFFIDPSIGQIFTHNDLYNYFNKTTQPVLPDYFKPQGNKKIIEKLLADLSQCYSIDHKLYMKAEIIELIEIINS